MAAVGVDGGAAPREMCPGDPEAGAAARAPSGAGVAAGRCRSPSPELVLPDDDDDEWAPGAMPDSPPLPSLTGAARDDPSPSPAPVAGAGAAPGAGVAAATAGAAMTGAGAGAMSPSGDLADAEGALGRIPGTTARSPLPPSLAEPTTGDAGSGGGGEHAETPGTTPGRVVGVKGAAGGPSPTSSNEGSGGRHAPRRGPPAARDEGHGEPSSVGRTRAGVTLGRTRSLAGDLAAASGDAPSLPPEIASASAGDEDTRLFLEKILGETGEVLEGWTVERKMRESGAQAGVPYFFYHPPPHPEGEPGKQLWATRFRSVKEVLRYVRARKGGGEERSRSGARAHRTRAGDPGPAGQGR